MHIICVWGNHLCLGESFLRFAHLTIASTDSTAWSVLPRAVRLANSSFYPQSRSEAHFNRIKHNELFPHLGSFSTLYMLYIVCIQRTQLCSYHRCSVNGNGLPNAPL